MLKSWTKHILLPFTLIAAPTMAGSLTALADEGEHDVAADTEARFDVQELLEALAAGSPDRPITLPAGTTGQQVEAAFNALNAKLKIRDDDNRRLDADEDLVRSLSENGKRGLEKLRQGFAAKVADGSIVPRRNPQGRLIPTPANGQYTGQGRGNAEIFENAVGDGWWRWSTSYSWWGVRASVNHNFLYYICAYTSWLLNASSMPSWIENVIRLIGCSLHSFDSGQDGSTVYVTWAGFFWYSA